jgi:hypothetical protein
MGCEIQDFKPENDRYLISKALAKISLLYGDRGIVASNVYTYFRWIDDNIDSSIGSISDKITFLKRQEDVINGIFPETLHPVESCYINSPWSAVSDQQKSYKEHASVLLETMKNDVLHQGCIPRTYEEIKLHNIGTLLPCFQFMTLLLNGKEIPKNDKFDDLADHWNSLGSLRDLSDDLNCRMLEIGFTREEIEKILELPTASERKTRVLDIYNPKRFQKEKKYNIKGLTKTAGSFLNIGMPLWQSLLSVAYLGRLIIKSFIVINYPSLDTVGNIKREALKEKTKRVCLQNGISS